MLKCAKGAIISKKFTYENHSDKRLSIEVISSTPAVVEVSTPLLVLEGGAKEAVKFIIKAPNTACYMDAKILIRNYETEAPEELVMFQLDIE